MRRHMVWAEVVSLALQTDVQGSQSRAKNTAFYKGLENWQNSQFLGEKVTRKSEMLILRGRRRLGDLYAGLAAKKNHLNMNIQFD
jgi:hypothetical protein